MLASRISFANAVNHLVPLPYSYCLFQQDQHTSYRNIHPCPYGNFVTREEVGERGEAGRLADAVVAGVNAMPMCIEKLVYSNATIAQQ